jgi:hypothetical protein
MAEQEQEARNKLGPIEILSSVDIGTKQDDNIFDDDNNEQDDTITGIFPSLNLRLPFGKRRRHWLEVAYGQSFNYFGRWERENYKNKNLLGRLVLDFPGGLSFELSNNWAQIITPSSSLEESELGPRTQRDQNDTELIVGYKFSRRFEIEGSFLHTNIIYDEPANDSENRRENIGRFTIYYRIFPKTSALLETRIGQVNFTKTTGVASFDNFVFQGDDTSEDSRFQEVNLGLRFDPGAKLDGSLRLGVQFREFINRYGPNIDDPISGTSRPSQMDDTMVFSINTNLLWSISPRTRVDLSVFRGIEESAFIGNNYWVSTRFALGLSQDIGRKITVHPSIYWESGSFPERSNDPKASIPGMLRTRRDAIIQPTLELRYQVREWLAFYLSYNYRLRNSNFHDRESRRQQFAAGMAIVY